VIIFKYFPEYLVLDSVKVRENYRVCVSHIKTLHSLPVKELTVIADNALPFNVFEACDEHLSYCKTNGIHLPENIDKLFDTLHQWRDIICSVPPPTECASFVLCHNDLSSCNILARFPTSIKEDLQLRFVDFEHASLGDRFFDLANFSRLNQFQDEDDVLLLKVYFGKFNDKHMVRLQLLKAVADLHEAMRNLSLCPHIYNLRRMMMPQQKATTSATTAAEVMMEEEEAATEIIDQITSSHPTTCLFPSTLSSTKGDSTSLVVVDGGTVDTSAQQLSSVDDAPQNDMSKKEIKFPFDSTAAAAQLLLPPFLMERTKHCLKCFESKALSVAYTTYLQSGLLS
jgi:thiamine kinase-like enzyme